MILAHRCGCSNHSTPAIYLFSSMDRTLGYGPKDTSSNLVGDTKKNKKKFDFYKNLWYNKYVKIKRNKNSYIDIGPVAQ